MGNLPVIYGNGNIPNFTGNFRTLLYTGIHQTIIDGDGGVFLFLWVWSSD